MNAVFADVTLRWNTGGWLFEARATNLFNKKEYSYTQYSDHQSYTSSLGIRPREFLVSARYRF
ncbi:MAG: TonB-dependent receptor [Tannerellaceae bacterium]|nr:TonB-dependent receptor [Tannerellaceae bacterium]